MNSTTTTIFLVRHGETNINIVCEQSRNHPDFQKIMDDYDDNDPCLTNLGKQQAEVVGKFLAQSLSDTKVSVLTSPFTRTIETSKPFCDIFTNNINVYENDDLLLEFLRPGREKYLTKEQVKRGIRCHSSWEDFTNQVKQFVDVLEAMCVSTYDPIGETLNFFYKKKN